MIMKISFFLMKKLILINDLKPYITKIIKFIIILFYYTVPESQLGNFVFLSFFNPKERDK